MAITYGFYNSVNHDRVFDAVQLSSIFDGILKDGVFMAIGTAMAVKAGTGMNILVGKGRAWFNHTWTYNDSDMPLTVTQSNAVLPRIDTVVLEINSDSSVRTNSIKILQGTAATNPTQPVLTKTASLNQYPLANIAIGAGVTSISQANITNRVGTSECPYATGIIQNMNIDNLVSQWDAEWDQWVNVHSSEFLVWFNSMKNQLSTDAAGNLQLQIDAITGNHTVDDTQVPSGNSISLYTILNGLANGIKRITGKSSWLTAPAITLEALKTHKHEDGYGEKITANGIAMNAGIEGFQLAQFPTISGSQIFDQSIEMEKIVNSGSRFHVRFGGSLDDWTVPGTTPRSLDWPFKIVIGSSAISIDAMGVMTVSLLGFSKPPIVLPAIQSSVQTFPYTVRVKSTTASQVRFLIENHTDIIANPDGGQVIWVAFGE